MPSMRSHGSSSRRSNTPQVNAPCAPPPCSAKSTRSGARFDSTMLVILGHGYDGLLTCRADQDAAATSFGADPLGPLAARCALVTAKPECVREGASLSSTGPRPTSSGRSRMASSLRPVTVAPKGMGLYDFVALQEGFFAAEGLDVDLDWKTFRGTQSSWKELAYFQRPQDRPYTQDKREVIQGACVWGTICNASAGMGKMVPDAYGVSPWAIFVRPDSRIRRPEDLKDVPVSVGMRAGSHFNVPYRLEKYLPLGLRQIIADTFKTLWWVPDNFEPDVVRAYLRALDRAEKAMDDDMEKYLPLWKLAVPAEFENVHAWDYSKFGRGERFYYRTLPREEFDDTLAQVKRWGLDQYLKDRSYETLSYSR